MGVHRSPSASSPPAPACPLVPGAEEEAAGDDFEEDAADREARRKAAAEAARLAELRKRSNVMQRGLPRPASLELLPAARPDEQVGCCVGVCVCVVVGISVWCGVLVWGSVGRKGVRGAGQHSIEAAWVVLKGDPRASTPGFPATGGMFCPHCFHSPATGAAVCTGAG